MRAELEPSADASERRLTRGAAVAAAAGIAGAAVVGARGAGKASAAEKPFSPGFAEVIYGRLRAVAPNAIDIATSGGVQSVSFTPTALFWREGPATLSDFQIGEEVLVEGDSHSGQFVGYDLINMYRGLDAHVVGRDGSHLRTDHGRVRLIAATRFADRGSVSAVPAAKTALGADVQVLGRLDPDAGELVALRFYDHHA